MEELKDNPFAPYEKQITVADRKKMIAPMLVELRKAHHLNQRTVAELLEVSPQTYNGWEKSRNEPPIEHLVRLSFLYDISLDTLCGRNLFVIPTKDNMNNELGKLHQQINDLQKKLDTEDCPPEQRQQLQTLLDSLRIVVQTAQDVNAQRSEVITP